MVSPDGERIAALHASPGENGADIWIYDRPDERLTRLTRTGDVSHPRWTPDSQYIALVREGRLFRQSLDRIDDEERLLQRPVARFALVPGGDRVVWERDRDLGIASVSDTTFDTALTSTDYWEGMPAVSPDGRWLPRRDECSIIDDFLDRSER